jgi:hypothetical protein
MFGPARLGPGCGVCRTFVVVVMVLVFDELDKF